MRRIAFAVVFAVVALLVVVRTANAAPPTKQQCIAANEDADKLKKKGSLRAARASLLTCANVACPRMVRDDCNARIAELDTAIPTITFTAKNGDKDTTEVSVTMDGEPLAKEVDGKPINVDPGEHSFTYTLAGSPPQSEKLVLREGEKNRNVVIQFGQPTKAELGATGRLVVSSSPSAAISIDGKSSAIGRFDGPVPAGSHEIKVSEPGKVTSSRMVEVKSGGTETINVTLEPEKKSVLPWVLGGAAVVAAAAVVGGILLFSSGDTKTTPAPNGSLGSVGLR